MKELLIGILLYNVAYMGGALLGKDFPTSIIPAMIFYSIYYFVVKDLWGK